LCKVAVMTVAVVMPGALPS